MARPDRCALLISFAAAVVLSLPVAAIGSRPASALSCGILPYTEILWKQRGQTASRQDFIDLTGATIRFRTRGSPCALVQINAQLSAASDGSVVQFRAVLNDGTQDVLNVEGPVQFVAGPLVDGRSFGLLLPAVKPGIHTVRLQVRVRSGPIAIKSFSMAVRHGE